MSSEPTLSPIARLFRSRKFLLMLLDVTLSTVVYIVGLATSPQVLDQLKVLIALWQPVVIALITSIAVEDAAESRARALLMIEQMRSLENASPSIQPK